MKKKKRIKKLQVALPKKADKELQKLREMVSEPDRPTKVYKKINNFFKTHKKKTITKDEWEMIRDAKHLDIILCDEKCSSIFTMFTCGKLHFRNKLFGLVSQFLDNNWASRTNPKCYKRGFSASRTYNETDIAWFRGKIIELVEKELKLKPKKIPRYHY